MKIKSIIRLLLPAFILFLFGLSFAKSALAATYTLSGSIKDNSGNAIMNAAISATDTTTNTVVGNTTTDSSGNYSLIVNGSTYNVQVTPPSGSNFSSAIALNQNISANTILNFVLVPTGSVTLSGYLYNASGTALPNQTIYLQSSDGQKTTTTTAADGSYSLQVAPGTYVLDISTTNGSSSLQIPQKYEVQANGYSLTQSVIQNITLPFKQVTVHVQDASGTAVSNVGLTVNGGYTGSGSLCGVLGNTLCSSTYNSSAGLTTDTSGNVTTWLFATGGGQTFTFTATPPTGSIYLTTSFSSSVTGNMTVPITLQQPVTLSGNLYDPANNPVPNQTIYLQSSGGQKTTTTTAADGSYSLQVAPGTYFLDISGTNSNTALEVPQHYEVQANGYSLTQNTTLNLVLPFNKVIVQTQNATGSPVNSMGITVSGGYTGSGIYCGISGNTLCSSTYNSSAGLTTDTSGNVTTWLFTNSGSQNFTITATPPTGSTYLTTSVTAHIIGATTVPITMQQQPVTLSGHIYNASGTPLPNQTVYLQASNGQKVTTTTAADGSYSLQAVPNTYLLDISATNNSVSLQAPQQYEIQANDYSLSQNTTLNLTLPLKQVTIHVQNPLNNPISNVGVSISSPNGYATTGIYCGILGNTLCTVSYNNSAGLSTDNLGNTTAWLFVTSGPYTYSLTATPPTGSIYSPFTLDNVTITGNQTELVALQYNHAAPVTTANLATQNADGTYSDPTTVTLSATAASGYTIANTYYTIDGGTQQTYTAPFTVTGSGSHTITYWSVDNSGVPEAANTKSFTIYTNKAPVVGSLTNATINEGDTYNATGSFTDADSTSWTANVDYGDGSGAQPLKLSGQNFSLSHVYKDNGTYTVTVNVTDNQGATGTTSATITVNNVAPTVGAIDAPTSPVEPNTSVSVTANFTDPGVLDTHTASWNWGDNSTSNGTVTEANGSGSVIDSHTYTIPGSYTITLTVTDKVGASSSSTTQIIVNAPPTASAGGPYTVNEGSTVTLTGTGTDPDGDTLSYAWDLTGGTNFTTSGQSVTFHGTDGPRTQTVAFQVCDTFGACATDTTTVTVNNVSPTVNAITVTPNQPQQNAAITATATFTDPGILDTHAAVWNWGDGTTSTGTVTESNGSGSVADSHTYTGFGTYTITLTVTDKDGGVGTQTTQTFVNAPPVANAGGTYTMNEGETILLTGSATDPDNDTLTYSWDLNNDGAYGLTGQTALFSAQDGPATKTVNLKVCDSNGACALSSATINVTNVAPTVTNVTLTPNQLQQGGTTSVTANFTDPGVLDTHTAVIDWGDGQTSTGTLSETNGSGTVTGNHVYATYGNYTVTVTVTDKDGGVGSNTASLFVNAPPTANAGGTYVVNEGSTLVLSGTGADPDGDTLTYNWDLNNDGVYDITGQQAVFSAVDGPATKTVTLQVCDTHNACTTDTATITINNVAPTVGTITAPTTPVQANTAISASANFTDPGTLDTHTASWNWGDGTTSTGTVTESNGNGSVGDSHTYTAAGIYTITLTVTDKDGGVGQKSFIYVVVYDPSAGWASGSKDYTSPTGAVVGNTSATGTASFGFQVKYQNGSMVPSGKNVVLDFPTGNISFSSTGYEWLVVNGSTATFKADGMLNGVSGYTALVSATDTGSGNPSGLVRFQIKDTNGNVVYDTQPGAGDTASPTTSVTKGQIAVH